MKELLKLLSIQSESGDCKAMRDHLVEIGYKAQYEVLEDNVGNIYMIKGDGPYPCVVAHMDTVHPIQKGGILPTVIKGNLITGINPVTMKQTGIGGDDKCGIWAALHCLRTLQSCKAAFFVDEEIGCVGSGSAWMEFFKDCRFVLQADRRGNSDFVNDISGPLSSEEFQLAVAPILSLHGYSFCRGMMSDVMELRDNQVGISCANISAGYFNPHSDNEYIRIKDLTRVCVMMERICKQVAEVFPFVYEAPVLDWRRFSRNHKALGFNHSRFEDYQPEAGLLYCQGCAERLDDSNSSSRLNLCKDCEYWLDVK